jgi:thioredoxin-like negative regulator of GroEL
MIFTNLEDDNKFEDLLNFLTYYLLNCTKYVNFTKIQNPMKTDISVQSLTKDIHNHPAILLYFFSNQCAPCVSLRPKVEELLKREFPKMHLQWIDSQDNPEVMTFFGAFSFPTLVIFFEGKEYRRYSKYVSLSQLSDDISRPYSILFEADSDR